MNVDYLIEKLGPLILSGLNDDNITEILRNPDGYLWFTHRERGHVCVGKMEEVSALGFVHAISQLEQKYLNAESPYLDAMLPLNGERINITISPLHHGISFNIRKRAKCIYGLADYVKQGILTRLQADILRQAIIDRKSILVIGSPASGKTTLMNALLDTLARVAEPGHRVLLLEQVPELQSSIKNTKPLLVTKNTYMRDLLWLAMRNSPDRIIIGEVRDGSALDMLKAFNTGCRGGMATIHANHARAAIQRVIDLCLEVVANPPYTLVAEALDVIVHIDANAKHPAKRQVTEIIEVCGFDAAQLKMTTRPLCERRLAA